MRLTAGELAHKALSDDTKYDALEVGHHMSDDINVHVRAAIENYRTMIDEPEFCVVMVIAKDPLIQGVIRRKFYCWPYLPKPRPNQAVFLYNKGLDKVTKRLWVLPSDMVMAELHSMSTVDPRYQTMKGWSDAFYYGWKYDKESKSFHNTTPTHFWDVIRKEAEINMPSEHEYFLAHREELIQAGCKIPTALDTEPFDFSKIAIENIIDTNTALVE